MLSKEEGSNYDSSKWANFLDEAQKRMKHRDNASLDSEEYSQTYNEYRDAFIHYMQEYEQEHSAELDECFKHYEIAISPDFFNANYILLKEKTLNSVLSRCKVMVLTANPIEKAILHFTIASENRKIRRIMCGNNAYFVFKWGKYWVAHIHQAETGANKNLGTNATIYEALKHFTPNVIISLGVAFGIDYKNQNIGDVLVSKRILPYSENKRDEDKVKPDRSQDKNIDDWLHVRLSNANGFLDRTLYGDILSGGSVMSSFIEKDKICSGYTKADFIIGGEMEGDAIFQYAKRGGIPGVVIKGICDWGVAKNNIFFYEPRRENTFKKSLQALAMESAIESVEPLFNDKEIFAEPKNVDVIDLEKKYKFSTIGLLLSQLLIILRVIFLWLCSFDNKFALVFVPILDVLYNPFFLVCFCLTILSIMFFNSAKWKKRRQSKFYINAELKEGEKP